MTPTAGSNTWFHCRQPRPQARLRLFCFPYAGSGVAVYRNWPDQLPEDIEVCAVQLPGRDGRTSEPPFTEIPALVAALADGLSPWMGTPSAFFGHSMGALIAYELIRYLQGKRGPKPVHLIVSARRAPDIRNSEPPIHSLPEPAFVDQLVRRYGGIPTAVLAEADLMKLFLPTLRADFRLIETYRHVPGEPLDLPITVCGGVEDRLVSEADLTAWRNMTRDRCSVHLLPGDHFYLQNARGGLLPLIARELENSGAGDNKT
jgi:medium-chain acyl-[acyl-carrier-protein] hydrolase